MRPILLATFLLGLTSAAFATPQFAVKYGGRLAGAASGRTVVPHSLE